MRSRKELANTLRILAMDAVERAGSGHPGAAMGMADMAEALWRGTLRHNPANPAWIDRDRFVLSNGHASMLLYALLYLTGYDLTADDLRAFRQMGSRTPGHPEHGITPGVECTTGPLGQGLAMAVGMALAENLLAAEFNRPQFPIVNHYTYAFVGDGCLMEGISQEACSLAGTLGLGKLIVFYDSNGISIDGKITDWMQDDTEQRFISAGWHVIRHVNGHDDETLDAAITLAKSVQHQPSLISCKTIIGYGSPNKSGTAACHGSPLGISECTATRILLGWEQEPFQIPQDIKDAWDCRKKGAELESAWNTLFAQYKEQYPDLAAEFTRRMSGTLPETWQNCIAQAIESAKQHKNIATRNAGKAVLDEISSVLPELFGGSADLSGSNGTLHKNAVRIKRNQMQGNYLSYGVREFLMSAMMNGMALHGGFIPYGGTFLVFSDYARNAIRMAALMQTHAIWILTHDSIGLGEDGPTHQPVEQITSLRLIPNLAIWRPCDAIETAVAWQKSIETKSPSCIIMTRQNLPLQERTEQQIADIARGGYILKDCDGDPEVILIATGSEVDLAVQATKLLTGHKMRVISMPSTTVFDAQPAAYREKILPAKIRRRVAIEAGSADGWWKYTGLDGAIIGMTTFGTSAPAPELFRHFGFTPEHIAEVTEKLLQ